MPNTCNILKSLVGLEEDCFSVNSIIIWLYISKSTSNSVNEKVAKISEIIIYSEAKINWV